MRFTFHMLHKVHRGLVHPNNKRLPWQQVNLLDEQCHPTSGCNKEPLQRNKCYLQSSYDESSDTS